MHKLKYILFTFLLSSCVIQKEVNIIIKDSSNIGIETKVSGSDLEDLKPSLKVPLLP